MKISFCLLVFVTGSIAVSSGYVYTRCSLTEELNRRRFSRSFLSNWICLIESESAKDTSLVKKKADGSTSYGIFQINSREWCGQKNKGGKCNIRCSDLINDDISDDAVCAKKIQAEKGFQYWEGWTRSCYKRPVYDVLKCLR